MRGKQRKQREQREAAGRSPREATCHGTCHGTRLELHG